MEGADGETDLGGEGGGRVVLLGERLLGLVEAVFCGGEVVLCGGGVVVLECFALEGEVEVCAAEEGKAASEGIFESLDGFGGVEEDLFGGDDLAEVSAQSADGGASPSIKAGIGVSEAREGFLVEREGLLRASHGAMERAPCGESKAVKLLLLLSFGEEVEGLLEVLWKLGV